MMIMASLYLNLISAIKVEIFPNTGVPPIAMKAACMALNASENLYVFGGHEKSDKTHNEIYVYNLSQMFWTESIPIEKTSPSPRYNPGCFIYKDRFYVYAGNTNFGPLHDLWAYHVEEMLWEQIKTEGGPSFRYLFAFARYEYRGNDYFAVYGGWKDKGISSGLYILNIETLKWKKHEFGEIELATGSMVYFNETLVILGGISEGDTMNQNVLQYDLNTLIWKTWNCSGWKPRSYFGLSVLKNQIFVFPGWVYTKNLYENSTLILSLSESCLFTQIPFVPLEKHLVYNYAFAFDSQNAFIFGGYSSDGITNNFLNFSSDSLSMQVVTKPYKSPKKLMNASLVRILNYFLLFGGMYDETRYNELWKFDLDLMSWERLKSNGDIPSPRSHHAAGVDGDIMVIFGGKDNDIYFNDAFQFNTLTSTWSELKYTGINPSPRFAACLMVRLPILYIYGGETRSGLSSDIYKYNISDSSYTKITPQKASTFELANGQTCFLSSNSEKFHVIYGLGEGDQPIGYIQEFSMVNKTWKSVYTPENETLSRSRPVVAKIGSSYLIAGGSVWATKAKNDIIKINTEKNSVALIGVLDHVAYQAPFVHHKSNIFVYGGGSTYNDLIRYNTATRDFFSFDLRDLCDNDCETICSPGSSYNINEHKCELCDYGTYSEDFGSQKCIDCDEGTFNDKLGASSHRQCYPCPQGTFNDIKRAKECLSCPQGFTCPTGSAAPLKLSMKKSTISSQPKPFERQSLKASKYFTYLVISISIPGFFILVALILVSRLRKYLPNLDHFTNSHNYKFNIPLVSKQTILGGVFSFLYLLIALLIISNSLIIYILDNELESKSLIPLVVLQEIVSQVSGNLELQVTLGNYGGDCTKKYANQSQSSNCVDQIYFIISDIKSESPEFSCESKGLTCYLNLKLAKSSIESTTLIDFSLQEKSSYASEIIVSLTADSSVPNEKSKVLMSVSPREKQVFRGPNPTTFSFSLTSSYFTSTITDSKITGFHVAPTSSPAPGSAFEGSELGFTSDLNIRVIINRSLNALRTERNYNLTPFILILALIGSIPGLKGIIEVFMTIFEKNYWNLREKLHRTKRVNDIQRERERNEGCFDRGLDTTRDKSDIVESCRQTTVNK